MTGYLKKKLFPFLIFSMIKYDTNLHVKKFLRHLLLTKNNEYPFFGKNVLISEYREWQ